MKLRNLFIAAMAAFVALVSCEEVEHYGIPELKVREGSELQFGEEGGKSTFTFMATRDWQVVSDVDWVVVDPESGKASSEDCTVEVSVLPNEGVARDTELSLSIGMLSRVIKVSQAGKGGATVEDLIIYANDFDKEVAQKTYGSGSSYPYLDQFDGWMNQTGKGAANVTYNFKGMSARSNSTSNSNYSDYPGSGNNNMFFGASAYLSINNIALNGADNFELTFGAEKYSQDNGSVFKNSEFHIWLSNDGGAKWVELTDYEFAGGTTEGRWNVATANFSVPAGTETLSMCMQVDVASSYRMDDVKLMVSEAEGIAVDFTAAVEKDFAAGGSAGGGSGEGEGGGESDATAIYSNNFDKEAATKTYGSGSSWPYLDQFDGWKNEAGTGADKVSYSFKTASARNNSNSNGDYSDYSGSGVNNIFFGANSYFAVHNITLGGAQNLTLTFGTEKYLQGTDNIFKTSEYHIWLSNDNGAKWVELTGYTYAGTAGGRWNLATANFSVPAGTQTLSICMQVDVASAYRMDDMKLVSSSTAGTAVDFSNGVAKDFGSGEAGGNEPETPPTPGGSSMTIAEVLALGSNAAASGSSIEGVVISNMDLNNLTSKKGMYIQDATGGLQFYLAANHEFKFGDKVKIDMSGVKLAEYNGAVQISGLALEKIEKISSGNSVTPKTVKIEDFLANKYEGQYVAIEGVQVAEADLNKTFVVGGAHTSINIEDAKGNKFTVFSSKYATFGTTKVPSGSGTLKGIASISKGAIQLIFAQASDYAGLTGSRLEEGGSTPEPPASGAMKISDFLALGTAAAPADSYLEGVVISNMDLNNLTSKKGMYIQDATGGLQFYLAANHEFKFGDKVKVDVSGVKLAEYNGAVQVSGVALEKIEKISSGNAVTPKTVKIADFLANKYEGQYVAIEGVQVAEADLNKTFVMGGSHTSINIEDADGKTFVVFSSKYATYGATKVPSGSGTLKGISSINNGKLQIIFAQESDFAGLTGNRFSAGSGETPGEGGEDPVTPPAGEGGGRADFETLTRTSSYGASKSTAGWSLKNCAVQEGGEKDANPVYKLIGKVEGTSTWAKAACMNGKTAAVGSIESPELSGGCGKITFNYANIFTESNGVNFKIEVIQGGSVVKTVTVDEDSVSKMTAYTYSADVNVSGSFKLKFTNLCPSNNASSNKDRVSIWNLTWTGCN